MKAILLPALVLLAGLALLAVAILVPQPPAERIRALEAAGRAGRRAPLEEALRDPDREVAAFAAILLRDRVAGDGPRRP